MLFWVTCEKNMGVGTPTTHWQVYYWNAYENQRAPKMRSECISRWHMVKTENNSPDLTQLFPIPNWHCYDHRIKTTDLIFYLRHVLSNSAGTKPCLNCHSRQVLFFPLGLRLTGRKKEENNGWNNNNKIFIKCEHLLYRHRARCSIQNSNINYIHIDTPQAENGSYKHLQPRN